MFGNPVSLIATTLGALSKANGILQGGGEILVFTDPDKVEDGQFCHVNSFLAGRFKTPESPVLENQMTSLRAVWLDR